MKDAKPGERADIDTVQQIVALVFHLANVAQTRGDALDARITAKQWMALLALLHLDEGQATCSGVAQLMGCTKQNAKQLMDALERKGFVVAQPSESDRRSIRLAATAEGEAVARDVYAHRDEALRETAEALDANEAETLHRLLHKVADHLTPGWLGFEHAAWSDQS